MDIRSSFQVRMRTLKPNQGAKFDYKKIPTHVRRAAVYSIRHSYRIAREHPLLTVLALFLILLYSYLPSLFSFLISSSPVIICTTVLLGTLLSFGEPYLPEIDEEEMKMSHDVSSLQVGGISDDLVNKKDEDFFTETVAYGRREFEEFDLPTTSRQVDEDMEQEEDEISYLPMQGVSGSRAMIPEEDGVVVENFAMGDKREIDELLTITRGVEAHELTEDDDLQKGGAAFSTRESAPQLQKYVETEVFVRNQAVVDTTELPGPSHSPMLIEEVKKEATTSTGATDDWKEEDEPQTERGETKDSRDAFFEKIYIHEEMMAEDASVGAESVPDLDPHAQVVYVKAENDETGICYYSLLRAKRSNDGQDDSGSDMAESSSDDASMADIIPMLEELRPFLDADLSRPVHINIDHDDDHDDDDDGNGGDDEDEDDEEEDDASERSSNDTKSDSAAEEHMAEDQADRVTQKAKPTESEFALSWTPDDEKNLMDLGSSELERNQRLENMIARRRARKGLGNSMSFRPLRGDAILTTNTLSHLDVQIPSISIKRNNPFDNDYSEEIKGLPPIPGSAPSVFSRRTNPFEFPYWERNDGHNTIGDGLHHMDFASNKMASPTESFEEDLNLGSSSSGDMKEEKPDSNMAPRFSATQTEPVIHSKYERQLSRLSDPRLSSISEPDFISPAVQRCEEVPLERITLQANHLFSTETHDEDIAVHFEQEERNINLSSIKESQGECDELEASTRKDDIMSATDQEVTIDPQSNKPHPLIDSTASLNSDSERSDSEPDSLGLSGQDLSLADKDYIIAHQSIEGSIPYDTRSIQRRVGYGIRSLSKIDAEWLREVTEMRKHELSGNSQESQAETNMHFSSMSSTEPESLAQLQVNTAHELDTLILYSGEFTQAGNLAGSTPVHPYLLVDEPVPLPSYSCGSESRINILPPISEESATYSSHEESQGIVNTMVENSSKLLSDDTADTPLHEYSTLIANPVTVFPNHNSSTASPGKETVNDGFVNFSLDEFGASHNQSQQFSEDLVGNIDDVTTGHEVAELDERLLSELDVVGDFSVQISNPSSIQYADKSISQTQLGDNRPASVISKEAEAFPENEELNKSISQTYSQMSPLPENKTSIEVSINEYEGDELRLLDSSFEHYNIEDTASAPQEPNASSGRNIILESDMDYQFFSPMEHSEVGLPSQELHTPEDYGKLELHSDLHEVEAECIDDIHHALKNFVTSTHLLNEEPTKLQFTSIAQDAEAHNLQWTDSSVERVSVVGSSNMSFENIEDIGVTVDAQSFEVTDSAVQHQAKYTTDSNIRRSEAESFPLLVPTDSSLKEDERSAENLCFSTESVLSELVITDGGRNEVEEKLFDVVDSVPVITADLDDGESEDLRGVQLTLKQKDICSNSEITSCAQAQVEDHSPEDLILKQIDENSTMVTTLSSLPEAEELSLKEKELTFSEQEKYTHMSVHSGMHEVEARSFNDLHVIFKQLNTEDEYGIVHTEPHEVKEYFAENVDFLQVDEKSMQTNDHSEMHEIEAKSLADLHAALGTQMIVPYSEAHLEESETKSVELLGKEAHSMEVTMDPPDMQLEHTGGYSEIYEIEARSLEDLHAALEGQLIVPKSETHLEESETKSDELLGKEDQSMGVAMDPPDMQLEQKGGYSGIYEIEARSLEDLQVVSGRYHENDSPAIDSEPRGFEAHPKNTVEKEMTTIDFAVDQQKHAELIPQNFEMNEVEAQSLDDLHMALQQHDVDLETIICSQPSNDEVRTVQKASENECIDGDSTLEQATHLKQMDHSEMHEARAGSLDGRDIRSAQHLEENFNQVQIRSADSMEREIIQSELLIHQNLQEAEELSINVLHLSHQEQSTSLTVPEEENVISGSLVHLDLHEIEAYPLDDLHLVLKQSTTGLDSLEKEVNLSGSSLHESEAYSLNVLHLTSEKQVTPLESSLAQSHQHDSEAQPLGIENMRSESAERQLGLHEIEVHSLDDLHLALESQDILSSLTEKDLVVETLPLERENTDSGSSESCLHMPDVSVHTFDGAALEPSLAQSDMQKVKTLSSQKERNVLESAGEHLELSAIEAESITDTNVAFEHFVENASTRDGRVEVEQIEHQRYEVCLLEAESCKSAPQVELVEDEAVISNLVASSKKTLKDGKSSDSHSGSSSSSSDSD